MNAESAISRFIHIACAAVRGWRRDHPRAPLIRQMRIRIDHDVVIAIPNDPPCLHEDFYAEQFGRPKAREALSVTADALRSALPAGAFPFVIEFEVDLRGMGEQATARPEFVKLSAAGVDLECVADWRGPLERFEEKLERLAELAPETMEKTPWYVVRNVPENERKPAPRTVHASTELAARLKGLLVEAPGAARKIMAGQGASLHEHDVACLEQLHVSPAGTPLIEMARMFEASPEPG